MRFMMMVKADKNYEAGKPPSPELMAAIGKLSQEMAEGGVLLELGGLLPSAAGARVKLTGQKLIVSDGPFAETKELIAGFWIWQCESLAEAIDWAKRCPNPTGEESVLEIRQVFENEDFGDEFTPELREQEDRLRAEIAEKHPNK